MHEIKNYIREDMKFEVATNLSEHPGKTRNEDSDDSDDDAEEDEEANECMSVAESVTARLSLVLLLPLLESQCRTDSRLKVKTAECLRDFLFEFPPCSLGGGGTLSANLDELEIHLLDWMQGGSLNPGTYMDNTWR